VRLGDDRAAGGQVVQVTEGFLHPDYYMNNERGAPMNDGAVLTLAADAPGRFARIVVAGVGANLFRDAESQIVAQAIEGDADPTNPLAQYFAGLAAQPGADRQALAACIRNPRPPLDATILGKVTCPVLVVLGDRDFAGPADPLVEALPDATFCPLRGVDHFATPKDFGFIDAALTFIDAQP